MKTTGYEDQTYRIADLSELEEHPDNPRQGDVGAITESIKANGWYGALTVQKSTGRILGGNHRKKALQALGITRVPIIERDVDDERALTILLGDNRMSDLASYDEVKLLELLSREAEAGRLAGTGYDGDDVDDLRKLWESDLSLHVDTRGQSDLGGRFTLIFDEKDRDEVRRLLDEMIAESGIDGLHLA